MNHLERWFRVAQAGSTVRREVGAGAVTFLSLSYILFVQPAVLSHAGMDTQGVLFATCVASAIGCFAMAALTNYPIALAPAMGHNFFFAYTICGLMGYSWQQALAANLIAGALFLLLAGTRIRERIMEAIPQPVMFGLAAGIGLLIAVLGLQWGALVVGDPATLVKLGDLGHPVAMLTLFGLAVTSVLIVLRVPGGVLIGLLVTAFAGWLASGWFGLSTPLVEYHGVVAAPPAPTTAFALDFEGLFALPWSGLLFVVLTLIILDLFDSAGTLIGLASRADMLVEGRLPRAKGALVADASATSVGACLGTSTVTSYVESAAGIAAGGRTGLVAVTVGVLFLLALFFLPLVEMVGSGVPSGAGQEVRYYPVIAPVLILVGVLMMGSVRRIDWEDPCTAIPAFLTLIVIPMSLSITDGIAWGMISYSLLALVGRRPAPWLVHGFAVGFVLRYAFLM